jgi:hypothetical protein
MDHRTTLVPRGWFAVLCLGAVEVLVGDSGGDAIFVVVVRDGDSGAGAAAAGTAAADADSNLLETPWCRREMVQFYQSGFGCYNQGCWLEARTRIVCLGRQVQQRCLLGSSDRVGKAPRRMWLGAMVIGDD